MAKSASIGHSEREELQKRFAPLLKALRADHDLRDEFLVFARERGANMGLFAERLKTIWWPSRKSMFPGFFVFVLTEFAYAHGYLSVPKASGRHPEGR
jgi:hypothetical protein